jgi:hypothetical protein
MNRRRNREGGGNINKVQELAAERTKYCPHVALETLFLRKQASGALILVSSMKERYEEIAALYLCHISSCL